MVRVDGHTCYVIGNGASRHEYSITHLEHTRFGCNQIYQNYQIDHLLTQDKAVLDQMQQDKVKQPVNIPLKRYTELTTRGSWPDLHLRPIKSSITQTRAWLTGEWCIIMAAEMGYKRIKVIGFDGGPDSIHRSRTSTNRDLQHCQPNQDRYLRTFEQIRKHYPHIRITTDRHFLAAYK